MNAFAETDPLVTVEIALMIYEASFADLNAFRTEKAAFANDWLSLDLEADKSQDPRPSPWADQHRRLRTIEK